MFFVILPSFFTCNLWKYGISVKIEDILLFPRGIWSVHGAVRRQFRARSIYCRIIMLKFQKILDKSRIGVYNHIVRSYSRTADQKCVDGCGFPPHAESAFTESCRLVQGSKASACDPPVADSPNPRCTYGRHGDTGVWLPPRWYRRY